eukprot:939123-Pyramimonas_sp.AAC.1
MLTGGQIPDVFAILFGAETFILLARRHVAACTVALQRAKNELFIRRAMQAAQLHCSGHARRATVHTQRRVVQEGGGDRSRQGVGRLHAFGRVPQHWPT